VFLAFKVKNLGGGERSKVNTIKPRTSFFGVSLEIESLIFPFNSLYKTLYNG